MKTVRPTATITAYRDGIARIETLAAADPRPAYREDLLRGVTDLAQVLSESGEHRAALEQQERAAGIVRALASDRPQDTDTQLSMVMVLTRLGDAILNISGDQADSSARTTSRQKRWRAG